MRPWAIRTREEAHLLNPAFCCVTMTLACAGYADVNARPMPFALSFLILPVVLHKNTRESLPRTSRTSMPAWLQQHGEARIGFSERLMALRAHTREAVRFGLEFDWMTVVSSGDLQRATSNAVIGRATRSLRGDARDCVSRARFLGKWLASAGSTATVMALWGVRP